MDKPNSEKKPSDEDLIEAAISGKNALAVIFRQSRYLKLAHLGFIYIWKQDKLRSPKTPKEEKNEPNRKETGSKEDFLEKTLPSLLTELINNLYVAITQEALLAKDIQPFVESFTLPLSEEEGKKYPLAIENKTRYSQEGLLAAAVEGQEDCLRYVADAGLVPQIYRYLKTKGHEKDHYADILQETVKRFHRRATAKNSSPITAPLGMLLVQLRQSGYYIRRKHGAKHKGTSVIEYIDFIRQSHSNTPIERHTEADAAIEKKAYHETTARYQKKLYDKLRKLRVKDLYRYDTVVRGNKLSEFRYRREDLGEILGPIAIKCRRIVGKLNTARKAKKAKIISAQERKLDALRESPDRLVIDDFIWLHSKLVNGWAQIGTIQLARNLVHEKFRDKKGGIRSWYYKEGKKEVVDGKAVGRTSSQVYSAWCKQQLPRQNKNGKAIAVVTTNKH